MVRFKHVFLLSKIIVAIGFLNGLLDISWQADTYSFTFGAYNGQALGPGTMITSLIGSYISRFFTPSGLYLISSIITSLIFIFFVEKYCKGKDKLYLYILLSLPIFSIFTLGYNKEVITIIFYFLIYIVSNSRKSFIFYKLIPLIVLFSALSYIRIAAIVPLITLIIYQNILQSQVIQSNKKLLILLSPVIFLLTVFSLYHFIGLELLQIENNINFQDNTSRNYGDLRSINDLIYFMPLGLYYFWLGQDIKNLFNGIGFLFLLENLTYLLILFKLFQFRKYQIRLNDFLTIILYFSITISAIYPLFYYNATSSMRYKIPTLLTFLYFLMTKNKLIKNYPRDSNTPLSYS